ncbi:hypothetical protein J3R30DRAFT_3470398 [Lentinula aciculospora]|uniref:Transmembrane protein n=1 Tax=Lentinula aciculospora TaxID=153920 RepID=A0A9W9DQK0_9AGAR|nr:hypothetical protein J3R30DRAFT_3470398 [Lentinula aciculospora]
MSAIPASSTAIDDSIAQISPSLDVIVVCATWFGVSVPMMFLLFWTTSSEMRRKPLFIANVIALLFAITLALTNVFILLGSVRQPSEELNRPSTLAFVFVMMMVEIFIDCILFFRVFVVLPPARVSLKTALLVYVPFCGFQDCTHHQRHNLCGSICTSNTESNCVCSICSYNTSTSRTKDWMVITDSRQFIMLFYFSCQTSQNLLETFSYSHSITASFAQRLRVLFWIALSNFVFPAMVTTVLLVLNFVDNNYSHYFLVFICNIFVETYGVLFATMWSNISKQTSSGHSFTGAATQSIKFAVPVSHSESSDSGHTESAMNTQERSVVDHSTINLNNLKATPIGTIPEPMGTESCLNASIMHDS